MARLAIDCGNNYIQIVGVLDSEKDKVVPLMDTNHPEGFLSYIAWNGEKFVTGPELSNSPKLRSVSEGLLKNRLAEQITLTKPGGKVKTEISGKEALRFVIKEAVLRANKVLYEVYRENCTGVTLAYPASWLSNQRLNLIRTLDGMQITDKLKINVTGTISEPAAGGLSYVQHLKEKNPFNVLVIDVGAGTTDVSIVRVMPEGQKSENGKTYYYDIIATGGLSDTAGSNFTRKMADLLRKKISEEGTDVPKVPDFLIMEQAEKCKIALTAGTSAEPSFIGTDGMMLDISVSREEYEKAIEADVEKIVECASKIRSMHKDAPVDAVVLTGGGSQVPMIARRVREKMTDIPAGRIEAHDPSMAIAKGTAAYATDEGGVIQRIIYDIAIEYYEGDTDNKIAETFITAGTQLPVTKTRLMRSRTRFANTYTISPIMEAHTLTPDPSQPRRDYDEIFVARYDFRHEVPAGTIMEEYMSVDKNNVLHYYVKDPSDDTRKAEEATIQLLHVGEG